MTRVEERLTELLNSAAPTFDGIAFDDVARRVRRRRTVGWAGVATAATITAVVAAASLAWVPDAGRSARPDQPSRPATSRSIDLSGAVPWIDAPASPYQPPSASPTPPPPTDARPCTANDVTASLGRGIGASGHEGNEVRFRNISRSTCVLKGYPQVTVTEPGQPTVTAHNDSQSHLVNPGTANMAPGQDTYLGLETLLMCATDPHGSAAKPPYHHASIRLPGGGTVRLDDPSEWFDVTCGVFVTEFYVPQPERPQPHDPLSDLRVSLVVPATVNAGTTLTYVVELNNPTGQTIGLTPCPGYTEFAVEKESYALNCAPVGAIAAHQTVRFEMRARVPANTPAGSLDVHWGLTVPGLTGKATVNVTTTPAPARS